MDELFFLPPAPVAMPRAYWLDFSKRILSSHIMLVEPSKFEFERIMNAIHTAGPDVFDMDILNNMYRDYCTIIPHRPYALLTGEFRHTDHTDYVGNDVEKFDPDKIFREAKFIHFSDWPLPKPWIHASESQIKDLQPVCEEDSCRARELWLGFYQDFTQRRKVEPLPLLGRRAAY